MKKLTQKYKYLTTPNQILIHKSLGYIMEYQWPLAVDKTWYLVRAPGDYAPLVIDYMCRNCRVRAWIPGIEIEE